MHFSTQSLMWILYLNVRLMVPYCTWHSQPFVSLLSISVFSNFIRAGLCTWLTLSNWTVNPGCEFCSPLLTSTCFLQLLTSQWWILLLSSFCMSLSSRGPIMNELLSCTVRSFSTLIYFVKLLFKWASQREKKFLLGEFWLPKIRHICCFLAFTFWQARCDIFSSLNWHFRDYKIVSD